MELTREEARNIVWEDTNDWITIKNDLVDSSRWHNNYEGVFQHKETGKYYLTYWSVGATEKQDEQPFEFTDPVFVEVFPKEVTVIKYVTKENL